MIQSVLWCAMVKISPTYAAQEFENDFKINLCKCSAQMKIKSVEKKENSIERSDNIDKNEIKNENEMKNDIEE